MVLFCNKTGNKLNEIDIKIWFFQISQIGFKVKESLPILKEIYLWTLCIVCITHCHYKLPGSKKGGHTKMIIKRIFLFNCELILKSIYFEVHQWTVYRVYRGATCVYTCSKIKISSQICIKSGWKLCIFYKNLQHTRI